MLDAGDACHSYRTTIGSFFSVAKMKGTSFAAAGSTDLGWSFAIFVLMHLPKLQTVDAQPN